MFALVILIVTSGNVYISLLAILCITSIISMLMGVIQLFGWKFGLVESICVIVFVGISVDYVVHICHQYIHSIENDRISRMNNAYKQMGATVVGGALTSCFSGIFLVMCEAESLNKFGMLLLTTIIASMLTSLVWLPSLAFFLGPEGSNGNISFRK